MAELGETAALSTAADRREDGVDQLFGRLARGGEDRGGIAALAYPTRDGLMPFAQRQERWSQSKSMRTALH